MAKALRKTPIQETSVSTVAPESETSESNSERSTSASSGSASSETPTLDTASKGGGKVSAPAGEGGKASESDGGGGGGGGESGVKSTGINALSGDGAGVRVPKSTRVAPLSKGAAATTVKGASTGKGGEGPAVEEAPQSAAAGVGGGPIDYTARPDEPPAPPPPVGETLGEWGATRVARDADKLGELMADHLDAVASGQTTGGVFSTGDGTNGTVNTDSSVVVKGIENRAVGEVSGVVAEAREAEERDPSHYKGTATYDPEADTSDIDVEEGPAQPPSRGNWSDLPSMGDPGYQDWQMAYQMWWYDCIDAGGPQGNSGMEQGDLPNTNHPTFEMLWLEYRFWWDQHVGGEGEPPADALASLGSNLGGVSGTDEEMRFDPDDINVDEYLQQGADPEQVNEAVAAGHAEADAMLSTANADADAMHTAKFAEAQGAADSVEADFATALPEEAVVASPDRPGDMEEYLALMDGGTIESEVSLGFDERMDAGLQASWGVLEESVDGAVGDFEGERGTALEEGEAEAEQLTADARDEQAAAFGDAEADTAEKRAEIKARQESAIDEAKAELDSTRDAEFAKIETERAATQGQVDTKLAEAEQEVDKEVDKGKAEAEKKRKEGEEKKKKKRKWWQKLWDFVKKVVKWVVDAIKAVFNAVRTLVNAIVKAVVEVVTALIDALRTLVVALISVLAEALSAIIQATLGQIFPELAAELCAFIDTVAEVLIEAVNQIADKLIETVETVANTVLGVINAALAVTQFLIETGLQAAMAAMSGEWGEFLLYLIESALAIAGISKEEFHSYFGEDPEVLNTVVDDPGGFMDRLGQGVGQGFSQFGDNFGTHLKTGFFEWLTGAVSGAGIEIPDTWDFKGILKLVLSVLGISKGNILAKVKEFFGTKTAKIVEMLIDYGSAFKEDGLKGVIREVSLDLTGTVREEVVDKAAEDMGSSGMGLMDSLLDILDAFANGDGLEALLDFAKQDLGAILKDLVVDSIVNIVMEEVIKKALVWVISLFNPVSALVKMLIAAWDLFQALKSVMDRIQAVMLSIVEGIVDVVLGNIDGVANKIEDALASLVPVAIEILAGLLGLGKIDDKIAKALEGLRSTVDGMIDKFFMFIKDAVDSLLDMIRGWFDGNPDDEGAEGDGALMDPMGLDAGGGPVVYWVEAEDGSLKRVVQGDPEGLTESWGDGVSGQIEGLGVSEGEEYPGGEWNPDGTGSLEGWSAVSVSEVDEGDAAFTPGAMASTAETPAAYLGDFAAAPPSVQSATWPEVGTEMGGLAGQNLDAVSAGLVPIEASIEGEETGGSVDVDIPVTGAAPTIDVAGPDVEAVTLPELGGTGGEDLEAVANAMPLAPSLTEAADVDAGELDSAKDQGLGASRTAAESLKGRIESVAADEAIVPIAADATAEVGALAPMDIGATAPLAGMALYAELSLPQDVHSQFDSLMLAESADALGPAESSLSDAETTRDTGVEEAVTTVDADAKGIVEQAGLDQVTAMDEQRGRIAGARDEALAQQESQLGDLEGQLDTERSARMDEVTFRLQSDQNRLDSAYADAKTEASTALGDAQKKAEDAEKDAEDPSWWDTLADYAQQAVDWLKETISTIFDGLRAAVTLIFDTVTEVAKAIIDEATLFITDALTSFGEFVQTAIQAFLGDVLPGLADALCELVGAAVQAANEAMVAIADKLKEDIDALAASLETALNAALDLYESAVQGALDLAESALEGNWTEILIRVVEAVLNLAGIDPDAFWSLVGKAEDTLRKIIDDPGTFVSNAINAMGQGFGQFGDNFLDHLQAGFMDWIGSNIGDIELPDSFDLGGVLDITLQVLGLDADGLRAKAEDRLGAEAVEVIDEVWGFIDAAIAGGLEGLWEHVQGELGNLWDSVIGGIQNWLVENVVMAAIGKLASMFTPVGALVQAVKTVWEVYEFLQDKASEIMAVVSGWVDSISDIANGSIDGAADGIEAALAGGLSLAIDLLANLMGLGGIGDKVQDVIDGVRGQVDTAIDALLDRLANVFRASGDGEEGGEVEEGTPVTVAMPEPVYFEDMEQEDHTLWFEDADQPELWVASDEDKVVDATNDGAEFGEVSDAEEASIDSDAIAAETHLKTAKTLGAEGKVEASAVEVSKAKGKVLSVKSALAGTGEDWDPATHDYKQHPLYAQFTDRCVGIGYAEGDTLFQTILSGIGYGVQAGAQEKAGEAQEAALSERFAEGEFDTVANTLLAGRFANAPGKPYALWSGGSIARGVAEAAGHTTLELTDAGSIFNDLGLEVDGKMIELGPWQVMMPLWKALSKALASQVPLDQPIHAFQRWIGGVYSEVEIEEIKNRARDAGIIDKIDMRYHALVLYDSESTLDPWGAPSGTPLASTADTGPSTVQCVDRSTQSGVTSRSAWLSQISEHEASAGTGVGFTYQQLASAVPGVGETEAVLIISEIAMPARKLDYDVLTSNELADPALDEAARRGVVQFLMGKAIVVEGAPASFVEDIDSSEGELTLEDWEPTFDHPLIEDCLYEMIEQAGSDNVILAWFDGARRWEVHPGDSLQAVYDRAHASAGVHPELLGMTRDQVIEALERIQGSDSLLDAGQIDDYRDLALEVQVQLSTVGSLGPVLEDALLNVINEHIGQHVAANPILAAAWDSTLNYYRNKEGYAHLFGDDGNLIDPGAPAAIDLYNKARTNVKTHFTNIVGQLEAEHGTIREEFKKLPKGIHFHHLVQKSVVPEAAVNARNLILARGESSEDLHAFMHLLSAGSNTLMYEDLHPEIRDLLGRSLDV